MSYRGWENEETHVVNVWITSDPNLFERVRYAHLLSCADRVDKPKWTKAEKILHLADRIEHIVDSLEGPDTPDGLYADMARCAIERVNWKSLAKNWIERAK